MRQHISVSAALGVVLVLAGIAAGVDAAVAGGPASAVGMKCAQLLFPSLTLDGIASTLYLSTHAYPAGAATQSPPSPPFCLFDIIVSSNANPAQSEITIVVALPTKDWNGRFLGTGNGGFAGGISAGPLVMGLDEGYAVAGNDMGTALLFNCNGLYCGSKSGVQQYPNQTPGGLYGDVAALQDFGYGAMHLMTLAAKELILKYYGVAQGYSYFHGCSTGGQNALMEAQRYPDDYDGILAGDPAADRTHIHLSATGVYETTQFGAMTSFGLPDSYLTNEALALAHHGVVAACAGRDGGAPSDTYLTRPAMCSFDATSLQCTGAQGEVACTDPNGSNCTCLLPDQALAMNDNWRGVLDDQGRVLYPGYERSAEDNSYGSGLSFQQALSEPAFDSLMYWAFGAGWNWQSLFSTTTQSVGMLSSGIAAFDMTPIGSGTFASMLNASNANYSPLGAHGGKLIMYSGYADPLVPAPTVFDYYNQALKDDANTPNYVSVYMAPGVGHCSGGPGANVFGNITSFPPNPGAPSDDILGAIVQWVEKGVKPGAIIATKYVNDDPRQGIAAQRPLCAYPGYAQYNGGDPAKAASFSCASGALVTNQAFDPLYGPY